MNSKRLICGILTVVLLFSLLSVQVFAYHTGEETITVYQEEEMTTSMASTVANDWMPDLAPGNHERWIDRIGNLPDYATGLYTWLEDNTGSTGALVDPTGCTLIKGNSGSMDTYAYQYHTIENTVGFTYTGDGYKDAAKAAVLADMGDQPTIAMNYAGAVYGAFDRDHPEVFWLSGRSRYSYSMTYNYRYGGGEGWATYTVKVYFHLNSPDFDVRSENYLDPVLIREGMTQRDAAVERILADCPEGNVYEQLVYLNRVLTETNAYNSAVYQGNSGLASKDAWQCISALKGGVGVDGPVCEGYARALMVLCNELQIPCVLVEGMATYNTSSSAIAHMWNYVQIRGKWYAVDTTWNDPTVVGMVTTACTGFESEEWLLVGSNTVVNNMTFAQSHPAENHTTTNSPCYINGPVLEQEVYVPAPEVVEPTLKLSHPSLTFEDVITMNVYFSASDLDDVVEMGLITYASQITDYSIYNADAIIPGYEYNAGTNLYVAATNGIAAKDMGDEIWFSVYAKLTDGTYRYTKLVSYSPKTYAYSMLTKGGEATKKLVVAMLNYGAAAQTYFGYNTDSLMNADLTADQNAMIESYRSDMMTPSVAPDAAKAANFVNNGGYSRRYPSIVFEGAFAISYNYIPAYTPVGDITMYFWNQADFDAAEVLTRENATEVIAMTPGSTYVGVVDGIAAKDLDKGVYVSFVYSDGTTEYCSGILNYSIGDYCTGKAAGSTTMAPFAAATAVYGYYAKEMFYA